MTCAFKDIVESYCQTPYRNGAMKTAMNGWFNAYNGWTQNAGFNPLGRYTGDDHCDAKDAYLFLIQEWFNSLDDQTGIAN